MRSHLSHSSRGLAQSATPPEFPTRETIPTGSQPRKKAYSSAVLRSLRDRTDPLLFRGCRSCLANPGCSGWDGFAVLGPLKTLALLPITTPNDIRRGLSVTLSEHPPEGRLNGGTRCHRGYGRAVPAKQRPPGAHVRALQASLRDAPKEPIPGTEVPGFWGTAPARKRWIRG